MAVNIGVSAAPLRFSLETRAVCRLRPFRRDIGGHEMGQSNCSGFLWRQNGRVFIVTNWHCVSGINNQTDRVLSDFCPSHVQVFLKVFHSENVHAGTFLMGERNFTITLLSEVIGPTWIEHRHGREIDLAALPLDIAEDDRERVLCINDIEFADWWHPSVASDCFIVGFPEGLAGDLDTPIWKRGSIATEPDLDHARLPLILVDSLTNRGLSGAPVIAQSREIFRDDAPHESIGPWRKFLGVYSGRLGDAGLGLQLGRVWKKSTIDALFENPKRGELPRDIYHA